MNSDQLIQNTTNFDAAYLNLIYAFLFFASIILLVNVLAVTIEWLFKAFVWIKAKSVGIQKKNLKQFIPSLYKRTVNIR